MDEPFAHNLAVQVIDALKSKGMMMATAESCTGGMIAAAITDISGSSAALDRGFVTYSNAAKMQMIGVPEALLVEHGAVSEPVARAMAEGALAHSNAHITVSVTGVAGPTGGSEEKPVGLVYFAVAGKALATKAEHRIFEEDGRAAIRQAATLFALNLVLEAAKQA